MTKTPKWRLLKYGAMLMLGSCAHVPPMQTSASIQPLFRVSDSPGSAYGYFLLGAYYAGQQRSAQAAEAYRQAIRLDPDLAEAHNALAMLHAADGRYDEAVRGLVVAARLAPKVAKFHNNLGYVYHLKADYAGAVKEFRSALALDAHYALASNNFQASCEQLGVMAQQRLVVLTREKSRRIEDAPCSAASLARRSSSEGGENLLGTTLTYLRRGAAMLTSFATPRPDVMTAEAGVAGPSESARAFRLEIANGNGAPGLARRMRDALRQSGSPPARITNMNSFTQRDTTIEYRLGFHEAARLLSLRIPTPIRLLPDADISPAVDVRLMLGKDITARAEMAIKQFSAPERFAGAAPEGKEAMSGESNAHPMSRQ